MITRKEQPGGAPPPETDMKHIAKKLAAVLTVFVLLTALLAPTAGALDFISGLGDLLGGDFGDLLGEAFGGGAGTSLNDILSNPNGVLDTLRERLANLNIDASNSQIAQAIAALITGNDTMDLSSLLNSNDFLNQLAQYLQANATTTLPTTEPSTTEEPTTEEPTTEEPTTEPTTAYTPPAIVMPSTSYVLPSADQYTAVSDSTTTEPSYAATEQIPTYTSPSTTGFNPVYQEEKGPVDEGKNTMKLVIGFALVSACAVAIVVVILKMKKTQD